MPDTQVLKDPRKFFSYLVESMMIESKKQRPPGGLSGKGCESFCSGSSDPYVSCAQLGRYIHAPLDPGMLQAKTPTWMPAAGDDTSPQRVPAVFSPIHA